ncbi:hypothetical protein ACRALDRAFT_2029739 [Sodiomyces alcalophilus JCM 7366]|uniref:uncharacterized protein n=1 Tax=Sodiomyces alcalophilus JCM 7366 TaxID=591952 RepID=UPI0039B5BE48
MANTAVSKVPATVTFQKPGTQPPLFIAGSFSDPPWEPQEMPFTTDEAGEHVFTKTIHLSPGSQVQYKLRVGLGDWWILNEGAPTVSDDSGNTNNLLMAPPLQQPPLQSTKPDAPAEPAPEAVLKPKGISRLQELEEQRLSSTPIEQVANTAAEVADTAEKLDEDKDTDEDEDENQTPGAASQILFRPTPLGGGDDIFQKGADDEGPPLLAHECFGNADTSPGDISPHAQPQQRRYHGSVDYDIDKYDLNDPTLERWPSDRHSIIEALRKVETGLAEDSTCFVGSPTSPVSGGSRRASAIDGNGVILSSGTESASSPESAKKLDVPRKASVVSHKSRSSLTSLASIAEECAKARTGPENEGMAKNREPRHPPSVVRVPSPGVAPAPDSAKGLSSDEDEAVVMQGLETASTKIKAKAAARNDTAQGRNTAEAPPEETHANSSVNVRDTNKVSTSHPEVPPRSQSPDIHVQPPDEMDELEDADEADATGGLVTSPDDQFGGTSAERLIAGQAGEPNVPTERPVSPQSVLSTKGAEGSTWIRTFFRVVFVDWIGAFLDRLWRGKWR